ncbi:MAG: hypothetical protein QOG68_529 [Solirubrobacteraceae bacterium]|jgi:hypothetical protein|nr:hypothetical protein [Solirubrobacteraceae bacterium]
MKAGIARLPDQSKLARPAAAPGRSSVSVRRREPLRVDYCERLLAAFSRR